jgi:glycerophosphoryl diester phosphodiesterase
MGGTVFGHRGAAFEAPENTMAGFRHAIAEGVTAFELDVHLTRDGNLAVIHDESLKRTAGIDRAVGDFTSDELRRMDASKGIHGWEGGGDVGIPPLGEVVSAFKDVVREWQIEIKTDRPERLARVCGLLASLLDSEGIVGKTVVTSWDPVALEIMLENRPEIRRGFIGWYKDLADLETAHRLKSYNACIPVMTSAKTVSDAAHAAGMTVTGWLGDSPGQLDELLGWGVEMITTNVPGMALPYLAARGFGP